MKSFSEELRYEYPLDANSLIIDGGGYEGNWFSEMFRRYKCGVTVFEPSYRHYLLCSVAAFDLNPEGDRIKVRNAGIGKYERREVFKISGDSSGMFAGEGRSEGVVIRAAHLALERPVDVLKLNIEGMEFEVLESLIEHGAITNIRNIQVQFHSCVPNYQERYEKLHTELLKTHEPEWDSAPVWQNYRLR